jgi:hypothetical protein
MHLQPPPTYRHRSEQSYFINHSQAFYVQNARIFSVLGYSRILLGSDKYRELINEEVCFASLVYPRSLSFELNRFVNKPKPIGEQRCLPVLHLIQGPLAGMSTRVSPIQVLMGTRLSSSM